MFPSLANVALSRAARHPPPPPPGPSSSSPISPATSASPHFSAPAAASAVADNELDKDARPAKRQKTQACLRCRRRKQKCDNKKPCDNCVKADEHCYAAPSAQLQRGSDAGASAAAADDDALNPLHRLAEMSALEQRISRIEQHSAGSGPGPGPSPLGNHTALPDHAVSLSRSTPAVALLASFAAPASEHSSPARRPSALLHEAPAGEPEAVMDPAAEDALFAIYSSKVQWRYPFLRLHQLRNRPRRPLDSCAAFFVNMIYSISIILEKNSAPVAPGLKQEDYYRLAVTRHLSHVFNQPDHLLHIQAYLILAMHAVYSPSTERIITITSAAMRYCVMAQLHCAAAEPPPTDVASRVRIQLRRRVFWCAYKLDRTVGGIYHLPFAIPDSQITVKMYANIDDIELEDRCREAFPDDAVGVLRFTDMSVALHVVYCRKIQSEILNTTLHRDFSEHLDRNDRWRQRVLDKLDRWRSLWDLYPDMPFPEIANNDWINMMYSYSLGMLYQPTQTSVLDSAGAWTVKASTQACLIFRKLQRDTVNTELWLGLITQFKCGVALLYTFFATPTTARTVEYEHPDVPEAVRACSITLTLAAERWPQSRCIRDTFDILAREIPLFEHASARTASPSRRIRQESKEALLSLLGQLEPMIVHRDTLRMIREVATEDFPSHRQRSTKDPVVHPPQPSASSLENRPSQQHSGYPASSRHRELNEDFFQPLTPYGLYLDGIGPDQEDLGDISIEFPAYFDQLDYF